MELGRFGGQIFATRRRLLLLYSSRSLPGCSIPGRSEFSVGCTIAHVDAPSKPKFADLAFLQLPEPLDGVRSVGEQIQSCPVVLDDPDGPVVDAVVYPGLGYFEFAGNLGESEVAGHMVCSRLTLHSPTPDQPVPVADGLYRASNHVLPLR